MLTRRNLLPSILLLALTLQACGDSHTKKSAGARQGAAVAGQLTIVLPRRAKLSLEQKQQLDGRSVRAVAADACQAETVQRTESWSGDEIVLQLSPSCDYFVSLQLGKIAPDGRTLFSPYFVTKDDAAAGAGVRISKSVLAGSSAVGTTLPLHITQAGVNAGLAGVADQLAADATAGNSTTPGSQDTLDVGSISTAGAGGRSGRFEETFKAANGMTSKYRMAVPADAGPAKAYGLLIYLHGDGAGDYREDWIFDPLEKLGLEKNLMMVSVLSPDGGNQWYSDGPGHAAYVHSLIQDELYKKYNVDKRHIYLTGSSGGSQFLTGSFVPLYGVNYSGGAMPTCGGAANWEDEMKSSPEFLKNFRLFFYTQTFDSLYSQVKKAITYYKGKGLTVYSETPAGGRHCGFDTEMAVRKGLDLIMTR
jgi:hypothetical protein